MTSYVDEDGSRECEAAIRRWGTKHKDAMDFGGARGKFREQRGGRITFDHRTLKLYIDYGTRHQRKGAKKRVDEWSAISRVRGRGGKK